MKRNFNFELKKKKKLIAQDMMQACIYILLIVWLFVFKEFEIGWQCPTKGDLEDNWPWIFLPIASWWI